MADPGLSSAGLTLLPCNENTGGGGGMLFLRNVGGTHVQEWGTWQRPRLGSPVLVEMILK